MVKIDITKRIDVTILKDYVAFKQGEIHTMGIAIASKFVLAGVATLTKESEDYIKENNLTEMFVIESKVEKPKSKPKREKKVKTA